MLEEYIFSKKSYIMYIQYIIKLVKSEVKI